MAMVAAEAGALCAEAEMARAQDAAGHMMALADQIQGMFALCEVREHCRKSVQGVLAVCWQRHSQVVWACSLLPGAPLGVQGI